MKNNLSRRGLNGRLRVLNESLITRHEVSIPQKLIRVQRVWFFTSPILSELGCGGWASIVTRSHSSGPFLRLLLGQDDFGLPWVWNLWGLRVLRDGCSCGGHWNVVQNHHCYYSGVLVVSDPQNVVDKELIVSTSLTMNEVIILWRKKIFLSFLLQGPASH